MYRVMKKLVSKKFYATAEEVTDRLDAFLLVGRITNEQYVELNADVTALYTT